MSLADLVSITISRNSRTPTRAGFGTMLLLANAVPANWGANRVRTFGSPSDVTALGIATTDPIYLAVSKAFAQSPAPTSVKVARRALPSTRLVDLTVPDATAGRVYAFTCDGKAISYTVLPAATTSTVATAIAALIAGGTQGATATAAAAVITVTAPAGKVFDVSGFAQAGTLNGVQDVGLALHDRSVDAGIATDLGNVNAEDHDWYGLALDVGSGAEIVAAAAWCESNGKIGVFDTSDTACEDPASTTDPLYLLQQSTDVRSGGIFSNTNLLHYSSAAWFGSRLTVQPGSDTWAFKALATVTVSRLTVAQHNAILAKNGNTYESIVGLACTFPGKTASGEYFDVVRGIDWLTSEIQTRVFGLLANAQKVPYTDSGADMVVSQVKSALADGVKAGLLAADPKPTCTAPLVSSIDPTVRATRNLPGVLFGANLAGAIHAVTINGNVSV